MSDNKVAEMLSEVSGNFKGMIDANSVIGEPITAGDGTIIVPISKVSFGFGGGGSEFEGKNTT
ncbi:MAG: sporulation protein YtfJ, partial [Oscillospiraceae bacterium]|nr:sporulation protein YtfJ [Oscillospiraceae bacterium]